MNRRRRTRDALCVGWLMLAYGTPTPVAGQEEGRLDGEVVSTVIEQVASMLEDHYVFPEIGARYAARLADAVDEYPAGIPASELAGRITADLQGVHPDKHLRLLVTPPSAEARPPAGPEARPVAATAEQLFTPLDLAALPEMGRALFRDEASRNHFFSKLEVLPGNVGYLDYDQFGFPNFSTETADAAFAFLSETDAIIIDLRGNRGGVEGMNQYLASHFFGEEPVHLYSRYFGVSQTTLRYYTFPDRVARRFVDRPLFVLVDGRTGSAAENFAFALQGLGRATIVGEATTGAAHSSRAYPVARGFTLQLPIARAYDPRTDEDWEGVGVDPDIHVDSQAALEAAHGAAIDQLLGTATAESRVALEDAKLLMVARARGSLAPSDPEELTGQYGHRRVFVEDGRLRMVRTDVAGLAPVDLVALAADYYTLEQASSARIRFERDDAGRVVRLHVRTPTGAWEVGERRGMEP